MHSSVYVSAGMWADNEGVSWQVSLVLFCELTCALLALAWPPPNHGLDLQQLLSAVLWTPSPKMVGVKSFQRAMPKLKWDQDTAELRVSMTFDPPSSTQEQELFVTNRDSFTEVTFVPLRPSLQLCCQVSRKTSSYAFVIIRWFCSWHSRTELAVEGRRHGHRPGKWHFSQRQKLPGNYSVEATWTGNFGPF